MSKTRKITVAVLLTPLVSVVLLFALFYFPPFQNWAVRQVSAYASEQTGMNIHVGHVHLKFPLDLSMEGVRVLQPNDSLRGVTDTVADIRSLVADIQLWPLLNQQVMVDELSFEQMNVNTANLVHSLRVKGQIGKLRLQAHGIDLGKEHVNIDQAQLADARIDLALSDTVPEDTTPSQNFWKIDLQKLSLRQTDFTLHMPGDTLSVRAVFGDAQAEQTYLDLYKNLYTVRHLDWRNGGVHYDQNFTEKTEGIDVNHLFLNRLNLKADSFYYCDSKLNVNIRSCNFREKSGLKVDSLRGTFAMDSTHLSLSDLRLRTPESELALDFGMDLNAFDEKAPGKISATVHGQVGKHDIMTMAGKNIPQALARRWPSYPLAIDAVARGNMQKMHLSGVRIALPTAFRISADGFVANLADMDRLKADVSLHARTYDLSFVTALLGRDLMRTIAVPRGITFDGKILVDGQDYRTRFVAAQGGGSVKGTAQFDAARMAYTARLDAVRLPLQHFLPSMGLHPFTGSLSVKGVGTDILSPKMRLQAEAHIRQFGYGDYNLNNISAVATARNGNIHADIDAHNPLFQGQVNFDALATGRQMRATISGDLSHLDLYHLRITDSPLTVSACAHVDLATDLKQFYLVKGMVSDVTIRDAKTLYRPDDVVLDVLARADTTHAVVDCGDFHLDMDGSGGYQQLLAHLNRITGEVESQLKAKQIDQVRLREQLPEARIYLSCAKENILYRFLKFKGYEFDKLFVDMTSSPVTGLNGLLSVDSLVVDSFQIDTVRLQLTSDDSNMCYSLHVRNGKDNPKYIFNAFADGGLTEHGTYLKARIYDWKDSLGVSFGLQAAMQQDGISFHLYGDDPVLGYKRFSVNDSNYVYLGDDRRVSADMQLRAADGMGIQIYTNDDNTDALQDVTVTLHRFDIGDATAMIPFTPNMTGILDGDFHLVQTTDELTLSSTVNIDDLVYEGTAMGNVGSEFTYLPKADGSHYVDGILMHDGKEVGTLTGSYRSEGDGYLDAEVGLAKLPLNMANGFIPDHIIGLRGYAEGNLTVKGSLSQPDINGEVLLDSAYIYSEPYGVEMRCASDPLPITGSHLVFEDYDLYANNKSPLTIQGSLDFSNTDDMQLDLRMRADNYLLIDARETARSEAYGKAFVNFYAMMQGSLDNLTMRGKLDVLGTTDLKYNLKDSPLTTDNQLDGLVEFVNLSDTASDVINRPPLTGFNMDLSVSIDDGAHVDCYLNADHSNYVDIIGGGDLRLQYNPVDEIVLRGRYTIGSGEMKYALPVIPLKTFTIEDGSYIEFKGDPMNPTLNITASETTKSTVSGSSGDGRSVEFTCGVVVTKTLNDMGLEFTIDAPEDMTIHNQLQSMSKEERGKLAVTMLTTGMYLADGNTSSFTMNSALSAFLNSQINQISGKALQSLDVSFGVENSFGNNGSLHTDYNFKFAKRFWNNRLRIVIGGKLSTGSDVQTENETFFDNVTFEYRLSPTSNKYLNLFYERDGYDWLEGSVSKFGGGFMWKRKVQHFKDLFRFKDTQNAVPQAQTDTTKTVKKQKE